MKIIMELKWKDNNDCLQIFKAIAHTNTMVNIVFGPTGLSVMGMDSSKTTLIQLQLTSEFFQDYNCTDAFEIGVYTSTLVSILCKAKKTEMKWKSSTSMALTICFVNESTTEFTLCSIDIEEDRLNIPNVTHEVEMKFQPSVLIGILESMVMAKSDIILNVCPQTMKIITHSSDFGTIVHCEGLEQQEKIDATVRQSVSLSFGHNAIVLMVVFCKVSKNPCHLGLSAEMPLRLKLELGSGAFIALYIAPKIEDGDYIEEDDD